MTRVIAHDRRGHGRSTSRPQDSTSQPSLPGRRPRTIWLYEDLFQVAYEVDLFGRIHRAIESANANAESVAAARDSAAQPSELTTNLGLAWGLGPSISWTFPNQAGPRARVRQAEASQAAALGAFDSVVLTALKETEQALAQYSAALDSRQALVEAQGQIHRSFDIARDEYRAGSLTNLDLLTTEQSLVALDAAVASSDASLIQLEIDLFKALGGGWQKETGRSP